MLYSTANISRYTSTALLGELSEQMETKLYIPSTSTAPVTAVFTSTFSAPPHYPTNKVSKGTDGKTSEESALPTGAKEFPDNSNTGRKKILVSYCIIQAFLSNFATEI
ncbi:unnamed protein product [Protopolystoma xenopodis]|uniref:Uncharacterized protein n=1 Tax=Protopolystoma xenopodis TaxID=117903 RepID=A0A3S5BS78_9PLAT|nr:unnamed protein product [Protopolystoma xenopodis]